MNFSPVNIEARKNLDMRAGDTVRVTQKIEDKGKTRLQVFEGIVLYRKHGKEAGATFTVRKTASGVGVERTFPLFSPMIETLEVTKRSKVRRSKLYYVRDKAAKEISKRMKMIMMTLGLKDEEAKVDDAQAEAEAAAAPVVEETPEVTEEVAGEESEVVAEEKTEEAPVEEEKVDEAKEEVAETTEEVKEESAEKTEEVVEEGKKEEEK
jgi:large subunit ribosomal protein L19